MGHVSLMSIALSALSIMPRHADRNAVEDGVTRQVCDLEGKLHEARVQHTEDVERLTAQLRQRDVCNTRLFGPSLTSAWPNSPRSLSTRHDAPLSWLDMAQRYHAR